MKATDELRKLLDERGVEWCDSSDENVLHTTWNDMNCWFNEFPDGWTAWGMAKRGTPEQAIAATLGVGTCELHDCEGSFSAVSKPVWRCDCGAFMTQYTDATTYHKPRFCPNCGRKVVGE